jgi:hypothetical protein
MYPSHKESLSAFSIPSTLLVPDISNFLIANGEIVKCGKKKHKIKGAGQKTNLGNIPCAKMANTGINNKSVVNISNVVKGTETPNSWEIFHSDMSL